MYARVTMFRADPTARPKLEKLTDELLPVFQAQKGFKSVYFLADDALGEYEGISLWESKEDAEAAAEAVNPIVQEGLADIALGAPSRRLFEVYEPNA